MNESIRTSEWIPKMLYADASTAAIIGAAGVYEGIGPDDTKAVYVVSKFVADSATIKLGQRRSLNGLLYDIVAWGRQQDLAKVKTVAERIDEIFSNAANDQWKGWCFSSEFENIIRTQEKDDANRTTWHRIGGTYRIHCFDMAFGAG